VPPLAQAKRSKPLQRPGSQRSGSQPRLEEQPFKHQMPAAAEHPGAVKASRPNTRVSHRSKEPMSLSVRLALSTIFCHVCINLLALISWVLWKFPPPEEKSVHEPCTDDECGHDMCKQLRLWMKMSYSRFQTERFHSPLLDYGALTAGYCNWQNCWNMS
jgi:hypothetical protein